jgi:hypothetical protein
MEKKTNPNWQRDMRTAGMRLLRTGFAPELGLRWCTELTEDGVANRRWFEWKSENGTPEKDDMVVAAIREYFEDKVIGSWRSRNFFGVRYQPELPRLAQRLMSVDGYTEEWCVTLSPDNQKKTMFVRTYKIEKQTGDRTKPISLTWNITVMPSQEKPWPAPLPLNIEPTLYRVNRTSARQNFDEVLKDIAGQKTRAQSIYDRIAKSRENKAVDRLISKDPKTATASIHVLGQVRSDPPTT